MNKKYFPSETTNPVDISSQQIIPSLNRDKMPHFETSVVGDDQNHKLLDARFPNPRTSPNPIPEPHWEGVTNVFSEALEEMPQKKEGKLNQVVVEIWPESLISIFTMG